MTAATDPRIQAGMRRQFALFEERKRSGARRIGWKVGFGAPAAREKLKIEQPLIGFLLDTGVLTNGATVSVARWTKAVAEPEIAIEIGKDLSPTADDRETAQSIVAIGPAIELVDVDGPMDDVEAILARDIYQRHVILGPRRALALPGGLSDLAGAVTHAGHAVPVPANLESNTGPLLQIVRQVAATLSAFGETLRAGDIVIAGSVTAPQPLGAETATLSWELRPIGTVTARYTA